MFSPSRQNNLLFPFYSFALPQNIIRFTVPLYFLGVVSFVPTTADHSVPSNSCFKQWFHLLCTIIVFHNRTGPVNADRLLGKADDGRGKFRRPFRRNRRQYSLNLLRACNRFRNCVARSAFWGKATPLQADAWWPSARHTGHRWRGFCLHLFFYSATFILTLHFIRLFYRLSCHRSFIYIFSFHLSRV